MMVISSGLRQRLLDFHFSELVANYIIQRDNFVASKADEINFDKFKSGDLREKLAVATGNLGTISAFA
jgi:hypothetical protein